MVCKYRKLRGVLGDSINQTVRNHWDEHCSFAMCLLWMLLSFIDIPVIYFAALSSSVLVLQTINKPALLFFFALSNLDEVAQTKQCSDRACNFLHVCSFRGHSSSSTLWVWAENCWLSSQQRDLPDLRATHAPLCSFSFVLPPTFISDAETDLFFFLLCLVPKIPKAKVKKGQMLKRSVMLWCLEKREAERWF